MGARSKWDLSGFHWTRLASPKIVHSDQEWNTHRETARKHLTYIHTTHTTNTHTHSLSLSQMINQGTRSYRVTELRAAGGWGASEMQGIFLKASRKSHKECFKSRNEMTSSRKGIGENINQRAESHTANSNCSSESKSSFRVHKPKNCWENRGFFSVISNGNFTQQ